VRALLAAGELKTGEDFHEAAFIFQYGNNSEDCLFAHVLAMEAVLKGSDEAKWVEAATLDSTYSRLGNPKYSGRNIPSTQICHISHIPQLVPKRRPFRKNASALQRGVPAGFGATRLLRSGAGAAKGEPGDVQRGQTPDRDDEGAGLPALGTGTLHENTRSHKGVTILNQRVFETTIYVSPSDLSTEPKQDCEYLRQ